MGNNQRKFVTRVGEMQEEKTSCGEQGEARVQLAWCSGRSTNSGAGKPKQANK